MTNAGAHRGAVSGGSTAARAGRPNHSDIPVDADIPTNAGSPNHADIPTDTEWTEVGTFFNLPIRWDCLVHIPKNEAEKFVNDMEDLEQQRRSLHAQMVSCSDRFLRRVHECLAPSKE